MNSRSLPNGLARPGLIGMLIPIASVLTAGLAGRLVLKLLTLD